MDKSFSHSTNHLSRSRTIFLSSLSVLAGGIIYILFRPVEPIFLNWFSSVGMEDWLAVAREKSLSLTHLLPQWLVYSLPNGLWAFAYTLIVLGIWKGSSSFLKYIWYASIPVLVFGFELLQLTGSLPGTFCLNDILSGAIGITIGCIILFNQHKTQHLKFLYHEKESE